MLNSKENTTLQMTLQPLYMECYTKVSAKIKQYSVSSASDFTCVLYF